MEALKIDATGVASSAENSFSSQLGILSGPGAFDILTLSKRRSISSTGFNIDG
jgi:hypothetical protein